MDVADEIVVLADGVVQQAGSPHEIYENPANPFVMSFLGPVTRLDGRLVRPHDVELSREPVGGGVAAVVTRVVPLGFEVRIEAKAGDADVWAQLTRAAARAIDVKPGDPVYFSAPADTRTPAIAS